MKVHARSCTGLVSCLLLGAFAPAAAVTVPIASADRPEEGRTFAEPLAAVGSSAADETRELAAAVRTYRAASDVEAVEPILAFLDHHPTSAWKPSLLANLAVLYRHCGLLDRALAASAEAWSLTWESSDSAARKIADGALATRLEITSALGRAAELADLLAQVETRPLTGHAAETVSGARSSLWRMRHDPAGSFRCGPLAIERVSQALHPGSALDPRLIRYPSTSQGTSLAELAELSRAIGLDLRAVKRELGSPIPVPAVVHWKAGHFAALVAQDHDRFHIKDLTFGDDRWMSRSAIEEESSGYLLAVMDRTPAGWRAVPRDEASRVRGRGAAANPNPGATTPGDPKKPPCGGMGSTGMPTYDFHLAPVSLNITDSPVGYRPPRGPAMSFGVTYNSREDYQPATFTFTNLGSRWTFNWLSYIEDDDPNHGGGTVRVAELGGGSYLLAESGAAYGPNVRGDHDTVTRTVQNGVTMTFVRVFPDGSQEVYGQSDNAASMRKYFLTKVVDPTGATVTLTYDGNLRLTAITDAIGQQTTLSYGLGDDIYKLTAVTDPFGRQATFQYAGGFLQSITDAIGMTSSFSYGPIGPPTPYPGLCSNPGAASFPIAADFMNAMTTPYGTTTFVMGEAPQCVTSDQGNVRWLVATDPLGAQERIEFRHEADNIPMSTSEPVPTGFDNLYLQYRNTYYWNQTAMQSYTDADPNRYLNATLTYHWLRDNTQGGTAASSILGFVQPQGQRRIWINYPGMPGDSDEGTLSTPTTVAQVLDNGQQQIHSFQVDGSGRLSASTDPAGRSFSFVRANGIDVSQVLNAKVGVHYIQGEQMAAFTYNSQHEPLTYIDYAGQTYTMTYDGAGNLLSVQRPDGVTVNYTYDGQSFLIRMAIAGTSYQETFAYDAANRLRTWTSTDGYTLTFSYDNLDRLTQIVYPDASMQQVIYDKLDVLAMEDRLGRVATFTYDASDRLASATDSVGRTTYYSWCGCGALAQIADPRGNITSWSLDGVGRLRAKQVNGHTLALYDYDDAGRLIRRTDALNQMTNYSYTIDNRLAAVSYQNSAHATAGVQYEYDLYYPRLAVMTDGFGSTVYTYNPAGALGAGKVQSIASPAPAHTLSFQYDVIGRRTGQALDGVSQTRSFDAQDRLTAIISPLGILSQSFAGSSDRVTVITYPNHQGATFSYLDAAHDFRLAQVTWGSTANNLSQFTYTYDGAHEQIIGLGWHDLNNPIGRFFSLAYDGTNQLLSRSQITDPTQSPVTVLHSDSFAYDAAGNRTSEKTDATLATATYDGADQLIAIDRGLSSPARDAIHQLRARSLQPPPRIAGAESAPAVAKETSHEK